LGEEGCHDFAAAGAEGGGLGDEEGDIGAEGGGDGEEGLVWEVEIPGVVEEEEGVGGVGGAAAEATAGGEDFVEVDGSGGGDVGVLSEFEGGAGEEVFVEVGGDVVGAAGELELEGRIGGEGEGVVPGDGEEPGFDVVEAVGAEGVDAEAEVELGGCEDTELVVGEGMEAGGGHGAFFGGEGDALGHAQCPTPAQAAVSASGINDAGVYPSKSGSDM
jgi:hypothetical protein